MKPNEADLFAVLTGGQNTNPETARLAAAMLQEPDRFLTGFVVTDFMTGKKYLFDHGEQTGPIEFAEWLTLRSLPFPQIDEPPP